MSARDQKIEQMRTWMHQVDETAGMVARALVRNGVRSIDELAERHPKQFNSLYVAIETMEEELPEPDMPWPT
jgi:hypothetical protein